MNYKEHYRKLCSSRQILHRVKGGDVYYELHHILPKSLGGDNTKNNLVLLTAREHYIAHLLLYMIYKEEGGDTFKKMSFALTSMLSGKRTPHLHFSAKQYNLLKEAARNIRKGSKVLNTVNYRKPKSKDHIENIRQARLNAPNRSEETKEKLRQAAKSLQKFPLNRKTVTCPFCKKTGQATAMKRWHFNKCKTFSIK